MVNIFRTVMNPHWYHGHGRKAPFFEGWYFKIINAAEDERWAFIPGVFINADKSKTHAFIQVLDGTAGTAAYHTYHNFSAERNAFDVRIGESYFTRDRIQLNIDDEIGCIRGDLHFPQQQPWPVTLTSPGIMGPFAWLPRMECCHGVLSLDHPVEGSLEINGRTIDFTGGRGYIEKDWGQTFPNGYIWMQTNHFETPGTSLTGSVATIPGLGSGYIVGLWHEGQLHQWTTYDIHSRLDKLIVDDNTVEWVMYNRHHELKIVATRAEGGLLKGPERTDMQKRVDETMQATVTIELTRIEDFRRQLLYRGQGRNVAMEVVGDLSKLLTS